MDTASVRSHIEQGQAALRAPPRERVHAALAALPLVVADLDALCRQQESLRDLRMELTAKVGHFRRLVADVQRAHPSVTYKAGHVQRAARELDALLARISAAIDS